MKSITSVPKLERVSFFSGQQLTAADLNDAFRMLCEMRWLHNRNLHDWGIALGLAVSGKKGDAQVTISPGYAVDCQGKEIVLAESYRQMVPAVSGSEPDKPYAFFLVISYPDADDLVPVSRREGVCMEGGIVRFDAPPQIRWLHSQSQDYRIGLDIIIAQAWVHNCRLARPLSFTQRRYSRTKAQPYIAAGQTNAAKTTWNPITKSNVIGFTTEIDTSSGYFGSTPVYQAHIMGKRQLSNSEAIIDGIISISDPTPQSFHLTVLLPQGFLMPGGKLLNPNGNHTINTIKALGWYIVWMGVEGT